MTLTERLDKATTHCECAISSVELAAANHFLERSGIAGPTLVRLLEGVAAAQKATTELVRLKKSFNAQEPAEHQGAFERAVILKGALMAVPQIPVLPVHDSVKHLFAKEFSGYANPPTIALPTFETANPHFLARVKVVVLRRFPAGQSHWELSGFPRRLFAKIKWDQLPGAAAFLFMRMRGLHPYIVAHLTATQVTPPLLTERELVKSFYRFAYAAELQPQIRGLMAASWLHSRETHRVSPHLSFMNRPYLEAGGVYFDLGPAPVNEGFLTGDKTRAALYHSGQYRPTIGVVMCTREQAIRWRCEHESLEPQLALK